MCAERWAEGREKGGPDGKTAAESGGGEEGQAQTTHAGSPGPALVACCALSQPGAQGRDPAGPPPAPGTPSLGVRLKAALQMDSGGTPSPLRFFYPQGHPL